MAMGTTPPFVSHPTHTMASMIGLTVDEELAARSWPDLMAEVRRVEQQISGLRARQVRLLRELSRQTFPRSAPTVTSVAADLDVSVGTARALVEVANRTPEESDRMAHLEVGDWSFDRADAVARLVAAGADDEAVATANERDIAGVHRLRAMTQRIRRRDEHQAHDERYVRTHSSLDESVGFVHGQLPAYDWHVVNRALDERADLFPPDARSHTTRDQRRADALVAIAQGWLDGAASAGRTTGPIVTVTVDGEAAARSDCEAGVSLIAGPRIGPETLDRIMCEGSVEVVIDPLWGSPLAVGPTTRVRTGKTRHLRSSSCVRNTHTSPIEPATLAESWQQPKLANTSRSVRNTRATLLWHSKCSGRSMPIYRWPTPTRSAVIVTLAI